MEKISCGLLGATGAVGQKFVELLQNHPWFDLTFLAASSSSVSYGEHVDWKMPSPLKLGHLPLHACMPLVKQPPPLIFSALDATCAPEIEKAYSQCSLVISNASAFRMDPSVVLLVPEVNSGHIPIQSQGIICNPNCGVAGLSIALKPLLEHFDLKGCMVHSMQAISGAGFKNLSSYDITDNLLPHIPHEQEKLEQEPKKILGDGKALKALDIEAYCTRVNISDGHTLRVSVNLGKKATVEQLETLFKEYYTPLNLPSSPKQVLAYYPDLNRPQPRLHRDLGDGMTVSIGGLSSSHYFDYTFHLVVHNTVRGGAGGAILCAELLQQEAKKLCVPKAYSL